MTTGLLMASDRLPQERCAERLRAFSRRCTRPATGPIPGYCDIHSQCAVRTCHQTRVPATSDRLCAVHHRNRLRRRRILVAIPVVVIPWLLFIGARWTASDRNPCAIGASGTTWYFSPTCTVTRAELNAVDRQARQAAYESYDQVVGQAVRSRRVGCVDEATRLSTPPGQISYDEAYATCWAQAQVELGPISTAFDAQVTAAGLAARAELYQQRTGKPLPPGSG